MSDEKRSRSGGVVVALAILPILGVAAYLFYFRDARIRSNEKHAFAALKMIAAAEADFRAIDRDGNRINDFWTADVSGLYHIMGVGLINREIADADGQSIRQGSAPSVPFHGYYFRAMLKDPTARPPDDVYATVTDAASGKVHNTSKFGFCAYPAEYGKTGRGTFIINENNSVFRMDTEGKPVLEWPGPPPGPDHP